MRTLSLELRLAEERQQRRSKKAHSSDWQKRCARNYAARARKEMASHILTVQKLAQQAAADICWVLSPR